MAYTTPIASLPDQYKGIPKDDLRAKIRGVKEKFGDEMVILTHHYQRYEIVQLGDYRGDSFGLSKTAAENTRAKHIVFCGVGFMAESAAILARDNQTVFHPDMDAGCPMADMADGHQMDEGWAAIGQHIDTNTLVPVTYMNSWGTVKAFCGKHGGAVCTSSNAPKVMEWAFERGDRVLFFPDEHLGRNTGNAMDIPPDRMIVWDPALDDGGVTPQQLEHSKIILWKGYCHVHTWFKPDHIREARDKYPGCKIVVHPECTEETVALADAVGSTAFIIDYVENKCEPGDTILIGTEINLTNRLSIENPDRTVMPLSRSLCPNMYKVSLNDLWWTLDNLPDVNVVSVEPALKRDARAALDRMLQLH